MRKVQLLLMCGIALASLQTTWAEDQVSAEEAAAVAKAQTAAKAWLALTDTEQYAKSWDQSAAYFQGAVPKADWERALTASRTPLGANKGRTQKSATFKRSLPGAPDGQYVVIQYQSQFDHKASAVETVTPQLQPDGSWRVSGYFIR